MMNIPTYIKHTNNTLPPLDVPFAFCWFGTHSIFCYTATSGYNRYLIYPLPTLLLEEAHNPWRCLTVTFHSGYESMTISRTLIGWRVGMTMSNIQLGNMRPGPPKEI